MLTAKELKELYNVSSTIRTQRRIASIYASILDDYSYGKRTFTFYRSDYIENEVKEIMDNFKLLGYDIICIDSKKEECWKMTIDWSK